MKTTVTAYQLTQEQTHETVRRDGRTQTTCQCAEYSFPHRFTRRCKEFAKEQAEDATALLRGEYYQM